MKHNVADFWERMPTVAIELDGVDESSSDLQDVGADNGKNK